MSTVEEQQEKQLRGREVKALEAIAVALAEINTKLHPGAPIPSFLSQIARTLSGIEQKTPPLTHRS